MKIFQKYSQRIIKFLVYFFAFSCFTHYVRQLYVKWKINPEIVTRESLIPNYEVPMPAVTICPPLLARLNKVDLRSISKEITSKDFDIKSVKNLKCYLPLIESCSVDLRMGLMPSNIFNFISNATSINVLSECSPQVQDIFTHCALFDGEAVKVTVNECKAIISRVLTQHGFCFTWNMLDLREIYNENVVIEYARREMKPQEISQWSISQGYKAPNSSFPIRASNKGIAFTFTIQNEDFMNFCVNKVRSNSFLIAYHLPNEVPTIFHEFDFLEVAKAKIVNLNAKFYTADKESLVQSPPHLRGCYFEGERTLKFFASYTKTLCEFECLTNYTELRCGCVKFSMPRANGTKICEFSKGVCVKVAYSQLNVTDCKCLEPCMDIKYSVTFDKTTELGGRRGKNHTDTSLDFQMAFHQITKVEKSAPYGIQDFIADCGGLSGIFLGFSVVSIIDLIQRLSRLYADKKVNKIEPLHESELERIERDEKYDDIHLKETCCVDKIGKFLSVHRDVLKEIQDDLQRDENIL